MNSAQREEIAKRLLGYSNADQTEALVSSSDSSLTRFARGICNQNVANTDGSVSVRAIVGKRTGVASTNAFDDASLRDVVERAIAMAKLSPADPNQPALASAPVGDAPSGAYVAATAAATPDDRAKMADAIWRSGEPGGMWSAGYVSTSSSGMTIANSAGTLASFDGTDSGANVKMSATDSTGFAEAYSNDIAAVDAGSVGARAAQKAHESAQPRSVDPGEWTVILEPPAFGELLSYVTSHFSAQAYDEGSAFFSGKLGTKFFNDGVTIIDDYAHPLSPGMPFDYEGHPKQRLTLVDRGTVTDIVTDNYYAHKLSRPNTGHALPAPNAWGPQAINVVMAPGTQSVDELVAGTKRGLLISRFWYIRTVDQKQAIVTGMTRDGTFLIEDGKITGGVRNMRFNQSIVAALANATFANNATRTGGYSYSLVVPTAKIEGFRFTSGTEF